MQHHGVDGRGLRCPDCEKRPPRHIHDQKNWLDEHRLRYCTAAMDYLNSKHYEGQQDVYCQNGSTLSIEPATEHSRIANPEPRILLEAPYPEQPYIATHLARFASGFERDLVPYGRRCIGLKSTCDSTDTFLDAGVPHCAAHLFGYCRHGYNGCVVCKHIPEGAFVTPLPTPRRARPLGE